MDAYVHAVILMMGYLISQVWREQNEEINVHLFKNASDIIGDKKTCWKKYQITDTWRLNHIKKGKFTVAVTYKIHRKNHMVRKHKEGTTQDELN